MSSDDFESMFIKAGDSETRKDFGQKKQEERAQVTLCFGYIETL